MSLGSGADAGPMKIVGVCPADGTAAYSTTSALETATRHMPLATSTTTIAGTERREECWQAARPFFEVAGTVARTALIACSIQAISLETPSLEDANNALDMLYRQANAAPSSPETTGRLHKTGVSNEWGGTRSSGEKKVLGACQCSHAHTATGGTHWTFFPAGGGIQVLHHIVEGDGLGG